MDIVALVAGWSDRIQNNRTDDDVLGSIREEVDELAEEIALKQSGEQPGSDGIFGEAVDILASTLDMIRRERPDATPEELTAEVYSYLDRKCAKWASKYGEWDCYRTT